MQEIIHAAKYKFIESLARFMGRALGEWVQESELIVGGATVVPVPLHRMRHLARGYNQTALISRALAANTEWPVLEDILARRKFTFRQVDLSDEERERNVSGVFSVHGEITGQTIIVVDDVTTTGATLQSCAAALKAAGASRVIGLAFARG